MVGQSGPHGRGKPGRVNSSRYKRGRKKSKQRGRGAQSLWKDGHDGA